MGRAAALSERRKELEIARQQLAEIERQAGEASKLCERFAVGRTEIAMLEAQVRLLDGIKSTTERMREQLDANLHDMGVERTSLERQIQQLREQEEPGRAPWEEYQEILQAVKVQQERVKTIEQELESAA